MCACGGEEILYRSHKLYESIWEHDDEKTLSCDTVPMVSGAILMYSIREERKEFTVLCSAG